jgi:MoxR-like ATPase
LEQNDSGIPEKVVMLPSTKGPGPREEWTLEELQAEADGLRARLNRFRKSLGRFFVEKQALIDLMLVAAIAQEPLLLVGPPGTAKSDLVLKFKDALGLGEEDYFEYMLTRFTEPSEIIGPIDITQLREGRYHRPPGISRRDFQVELRHSQHSAHDHQRA